MDAFLGRAYDVVGRQDSAIAAYTRYLETPWSWRIRRDLIGDVVLRVPAHIRLALLHEEAGNLDAAARHARAVLEQWDEADPVAADRVAAMRRLLQRVTTEP